MNVQRRKLVWIISIALVLVLGQTIFMDASAPGKLTIRYFNLELQERDAILSVVDHDVKSGDAILITTPEGNHVLVDSGMPHVGPELKSRLEELGVDRLDYAIATHAHWDHIGGFLTIIGAIEIDQFFQVNVAHNSTNYLTLQDLLDRHKIDTAFLEAGYTFSIGENIVIEVLNPPAGTVEDGPLTTSQINNLSLVMRLDYHDFSMLFTGDIYRHQENELVKEYGPEKLGVRVLDVPHHGEETSSSFDFIDAVMPEIVIISRDALASISIFNRYRSYDADVYVTGLNGDIVLETDGKDITVTIEQEHSSPFLR